MAEVGDPPDGIYIVISGMVKILFTPHPDYIMVRIQGVHE
jgi:CRP-like cAMP-binding protein